MAASTSSVSSSVEKRPHDIYTPEKRSQEVYEATEGSEYSNGLLNDYQRPGGRWSKLRNYLEVESDRSLSVKEMFLYNYDLKPVEEYRRVWKWYNFVFFWIADALNINALQIASTGVSNGLTWWQTWISVWLGYFITSGFIVLTSRIGTYHHICFPVACRSSFGIFGSIWPVVNRVVMAIIWFAVQSWILGQLVQLMLMSIFGTDLDTRMGTQNLSGTTTFQFVSFFIGWVIQLPFLWFAPHTIRHLFTVKAVIVPTCGVAYLIWCLKRADGLGEVFYRKSDLSDHDLAWAFIVSTMNCMANFATLILNAPDFSRFAYSKRSSMLSQFFTIPISFSLATLVGILTAAASPVLFPGAKDTPYWSPIDVLMGLLTKSNFTAGDRAGVFLISVGFALAQIGTNIASNSLSCGTDMTALLPRYINIRRGSYICGILALCICPWNFFATSNKFTTYLSSYAIFLSSITGVIVADYYVVRRGYLDLKELYSGKLDSTYMYNMIGCNWRAYAAYFLGLVPNMPGFVGSTGSKVPQGATYVYDLSYLVGFLVSFLLYIGFCWLCPPKGIPEGVNLGKAGWHEEYADVEDFDEDYKGLRRRVQWIAKGENAA